MRMNTYLLTYLLTPWYRVLFEELIVTQLVKKYPAVLGGVPCHHGMACPQVAEGSYEYIK